MMTVIFSFPGPTDPPNGRFYTKSPIIRLNELGQKFVARLVIRHEYKDGYKTHYESRRTILRPFSV